MLFGLLLVVQNNFRCATGEGRGTPEHFTDTCEPCREGKVSTPVDSFSLGPYWTVDVCMEPTCPAGQYVMKDVSGCADCPAGTYLDKEGPETECITCEAGTVTDGITPCVACGAKEYAEAGDSECKPCSGFIKRWSIAQNGAGCDGPITTIKAYLARKKAASAKD